MLPIPGSFEYIYREPSNQHLKRLKVKSKDTAYSAFRLLVNLRFFTVKVGYVNIKMFLYLTSGKKIEMKPALKLLLLQFVIKLFINFFAQFVLSALPLLIYYERKKKCSYI